MGHHLVMALRDVRDEAASSVTRKLSTYPGRKMFRAEASWSTSDYRVAKSSTFLIIITLVRLDLFCYTPLAFHSLVVRILNDNTILQTISYMRHS